MRLLGSLCVTRALDAVVMRHLELVLADIQRPVEHTQDVNVAIGLYQVGNAIVPVKEDSYLARRGQIPVAHARKFGKRLCPVVDSLKGISRGLWVVPPKCTRICHRASAEPRQSRLFAP